MIRSPAGRRRAGVEKRSGGVGDQIRGRLVAREQQKGAGRHELVGREAVALIVGGDEGVQKVVGGLVMCTLDEPGEVVGELGHALPGPFGPVGRLGCRHHGADVPRPALELLPVPRRDPEQLGDHDGGEREREGADEVAAARGGDLVQEVADDAPHPLPTPVDGPRREGVLGEAPQARVVGGIAEDHPAPQ